MPQICLGTAQFGMAYGITNNVGKVSEASLAPLLSHADKAGISFLDTAQAYGDSESVLGRQLPAHHGFKIISKLPGQTKSEFSSKDVDYWEESFFSSCRSLGVQGLDAFLLHSSADLLKRGAAYLEAWLLSLRDRGLVQRLGVSIYGSDDLEFIKPSLLDLVQLPLSLFDQRLLQDGTVALLRSRGTAIHARSLYLQGLLLTPAVDWPSWVGAKVRAHQHALETLAESRGRRLIEMALGFASQQTDLEAVVFGVCTIHELRDLLQAWRTTPPWCCGEWESWALQDASILDPLRPR